MHTIRKEEQVTYQKNVLNCWVDLFFCTFFFFPFHLAFSSCGSLLYLLQEDCRQHWLPPSCEDTLAGQTIPVVLKAHPALPAWDRLMKEHFPEGVCTLGLLRAPAHPSFPSLCQPWLEEGIFYHDSKARASLWVENLQKQLSWSSLVPSARSLGVCSIPKLPWSAHTLKDLYLLCQSKTWRKIHFYSFYLGALSSFFFFFCFLCESPAINRLFNNWALVFIHSPCNSVLSQGLRGGICFTGEHLVLISRMRQGKILLLVLWSIIKRGKE